MPTLEQTPGQFLKELIEKRGWNQQVLAVVLGIDKGIINRVIADTRPIDTQMALGLEDIFDVPAERFLELQKAYDLAKARLVVRPDPGRNLRATLFGDLPIAEMVKRRWLAVDDAKNLPEVEKALMKFFDVSSPEEIEIFAHAPRKMNVNTPATPAQLAWIYRVKQIASEMLVGQYSPVAVRGAVKRLNALLSAPEEARKVPRILAEAGLRYVIVESLSSAKIDGVCFWLNEKSPVIGMSLKHDRIDNFYFVLRHEIEHVLQLHGRNAVMLDAELEGEQAGTGPNVIEEERLANEAASDFCVPRQSLDKFIAKKSPFFALRDVLGFARTLQIHPGLVAGQIRHRTGRYDLFTKYLVKIRSAVAPGAMVDGWGDVAPVGF